MGNTSLPDFSHFINPQIQAQELMDGHLCQLEALITVALTTEGFFELSRKVLFNYFLVTEDLIKQLTKASQKNLDSLLGYVDVYN